MRKEVLSAVQLDQLRIVQVAQVHEMEARNALLEGVALLDGNPTERNSGSNGIRAQLQALAHHEQLLRTGIIEEELIMQAELRFIEAELEDVLSEVDAERQIGEFCAHALADQDQMPPLADLSMINDAAKRVLMEVCRSMSL
jgi:hypothetical protein